MKVYKLILIFSASWSTITGESSPNVGGLTSQSIASDNYQKLQKIAEQVTADMKQQNIFVTYTIVEI